MDARVCRCTGIAAPTKLSRRRTSVRRCRRRPCGRMSILRGRRCWHPKHGCTTAEFSPRRRRLAIPRRCARASARPAKPPDHLRSRPEVRRNDRRHSRAAHRTVREHLAAVSLSRPISQTGAPNARIISQAVLRDPPHGPQADFCNRSHAVVAGDLSICRLRHAPLGRRAMPRHRDERGRGYADDFHQDRRSERHDDNPAVSNSYRRHRRYHRRHRVPDRGRMGSQLHCDR